MRPEYFHPIERFPNRINQFLDTPNRVCLALTVYIYVYC
jgi:hypothetical protein